MSSASPVWKAGADKKIGAGPVKPRQGSNDTGRWSVLHSYHPSGYACFQRRGVFSHNGWRIVFRADEPLVLFPQVSPFPNALVCWRSGLRKWLKIEGRRRSAPGFRPSGIHGQTEVVRRPMRAVLEELAGAHGISLK